MSAVTNFRHFAKTIREEPLHYTLGITEYKGMANIVIGSLELMVGECMKCSSNTYYSVGLATRHVERGTKALKKGIWQILPAAIATTGAYLAYRNFS